MRNVEAVELGQLIDKTGHLGAKQDYSQLAITARCYKGRIWTMKMLAPAGLQSFDVELHRLCSSTPPSRNLRRCTP